MLTTFRESVKTRVRPTLDAYRWRRDFHRSCAESLALPSQIVKGTHPTLHALSERLAHLPAFSAMYSGEVLHLARSYDRVTDRLDWPAMGNPTVPDHLRLSSSTGRKGRILQAVVNVFQPAALLEIGTAYGLGTAFLLESDHRLRVRTVETWSPMKELSKPRLEQQYENRVQCFHRPVEDWLPGSADQFDGCFHDGNHSGATYVKDFATIEPHIKSGGFFLLDDLHWNEAEGHGCYDGWQAIVSHPRVTAAIEIDTHLGLAVLA